MRLRSSTDHRAWSLPGTLLFRDAAEADLLWNTVVDGFPEVDTLCLMPDHLHLLLPHADPEGRLADAESAFARARNARRGVKGPVWAPHPPAEEVPRERWFRVRRYILLNPMRKGLACDPLAWRADRIEWEDVADAVIEVCRCDASALRRRGRPRELLLQAGWLHGHQDLRRICPELDLSRSRAYALIAGLPARGSRLATPDLAAVVRVAGDPRFRPQGCFPLGGAPRR